MKSLGTEIEITGQDENQKTKGAQEVGPNEYDSAPPCQFPEPSRGRPCKFRHLDAPVDSHLFTKSFLSGGNYHTIIFGSGPVVIPLLREHIVREGWATSGDFLHRP